MIPRPTILVFDSGLGGLTVLRETIRVMPAARYVYVADDGYFPYGNHSEAEIIARVVPLIGELIAAHAPDLVVIACNTASTLVLADLRAAYAVPFVGTVPAIKPACARSRSKRVSVLGTRGTVAREYTQTLIRSFAQGCAVTLVGAPRLAALAEAALAGETVSDAEIAAEIAPCFVADGSARTDTVALACTHYPLLLDRLTALAPWPVEWIDPAPAIARRVTTLLGTRPTANLSPPGDPRLIFTSGRSRAGLRPRLAAFLEGTRAPADAAPGRFDTSALSP
ncbi:MAG: glutamate racemase [Xanthobacteraceae bacterium]